jgi:hypothetical protein
MVFTRVMAREIGGCDIRDCFCVYTNDLELISVWRSRRDSEAYKPSYAEPLLATVEVEPSYEKL